MQLSSHLNNESVTDSLSAWTHLGKINPLSRNHSLHLHYNTEISHLSLWLKTQLAECHEPGNPQFSGSGMSTILIIKRNNSKPCRHHHPWASLFPYQALLWHWRPATERCWTTSMWRERLLEPNRQTAGQRWMTARCSSWRGAIRVHHAHAVVCAAGDTRRAGAMFHSNNM